MGVCLGRWWTDAVKTQLWSLEGGNVLSLCCKAVFSSSAPAGNWLVGCGFVLALHWCTGPINHCSLSRPFINLGRWQSLLLTLCFVGCFLSVFFQCTFPSQILIKQASRICDHSIWGPKSFHNSGRESWPWQGTINNYHYNVSDTVLLHVIIPPYLSFLLILAWSIFYLHLPGGPD